MGLRYNDKTGEFEEENKGGNQSSARRSTPSASKQTSRKRPSRSSSPSQGAQVGNDSGGCSSILGIFLLIVVGLGLFSICYQACSEATSSSSSSTPTNVPSTYQEVNDAASDFSISSDAPKENTSNSSVSSEPAKPTPSYKTEEYEEVCATCKGEGVIPCKNCHGTGTVYAPHNCPQCGGSGYAERTCICGGPSMAGGCSICGGTGVIRSKCLYCGGSGRQEYAECTRCRGSMTHTEICPTCSGRGSVTKSRFVF